MKIGILGGTFDPIHKGHMHIASAALKEFSLDSVWFMPAGNPYFKAGTGVTAPELRLNMVRAAISSYNEKFEVCDIEINDTSETHTADTLLKLHGLYPEHSFYYIMGLDSLIMLYKWYRPDIILSNAVILCADRDSGADVQNAVLNEGERLAAIYPKTEFDIRLIHTPRMNISSSMIRQMVKENKNISEYVDPAVFRLIKENRLYCSDVSSCRS